MKLYNLQSLAQRAINGLALLSDNPPELVRTGLGPIDRTLGGLFPRSGGSLLMDQGVGKSSTVLSSALASPDKIGIVTIEDTAELVGVRLLAARTGINGLDIMLKRLTAGQKELVSQAVKELEGDTGVMICDAVGGSLEEIEQAIEILGEKDCDLVWVDYIQKIRGVSDNRCVEVAAAFTRCQGAAAKAGVAMMAVSQVTNVQPNTMPRAFNARETRDIANESRIIICGCNPDPERPEIVEFYVEKCTHGGGGLRFHMKRDSSGTLREYDPRDDLEDEDFR